MSISQIQSLNRELTNDKISMPYPHVVISNPSDPVALVLSSLPKGDLPIICTINNSTRMIGSIRNSAICLKHLLSVSPLVYCKAKGDTSELKTVTDILEVIA